MIKTLNTCTRDLLNLFFPHYCEGCGKDLPEDSQLLCLQCQSQLPETHFFDAPGNPVEKSFYGRLPVSAAGAAYYFTSDSLIQHLVTELKYHGNKDIGIYLGRLTALQLSKSNRFDEIDSIIPLPLNDKKLKKRGYNQAALISEGMSSVLGIPVWYDVVARKLFTETQTSKSRVDRWQTMQDAFELKNANRIENKHVLLVDDIITTGATLEACGSVLANVNGTKLSIASVAWTI